MPYAMQHASYKEYENFCAFEGIVPVPYAQFTWKFWLDFCAAWQISHSATNEPQKQA